LRIGLHIDNFDRMSWATRHRSRRRLCLNFGPGTRYLVFANVDVYDICRFQGCAPPDAHPHTGDVRRYVAAEGPVLCLRVRLSPGQGYIAPTELLPHDGSTMNDPLPSVAAFWLERLPQPAAAASPTRQDPRGGTCLACPSRPPRPWSDVRGTRGRLPR
jgi:hypothetical protein